MFFKRITLSGLLLFNAGLAFSQPGSHQDVIKQLRVPPGFRISIFADDVPDARSLALGDNGTVFVGTRERGYVYAVQDTNRDGIADKRYVIDRDLKMPNGVAYKNGALYVAEVNRIIRFDNINQHLDNPPRPVTIFNDLPSDEHHGWKYLRFGPDNKLYTAVGAPCNICNPEKEIYAALGRMNPDGKGAEIIAHGIRNTVGFDWEPVSKALYFTENGRDYMGDDMPPDELNKWSSKGEHFGFPYCHGGDIPDPEFAGDRKCQEFTPPVLKIDPHVAAVGMRFYQGKQFPAEYKNQLFVAEHGSWNRTTPVGYRVALIKFKQGKPVSEQPFVSGWLTAQGKVLGRPVDVLEMPDGSILISDDKLGVIYRVTYKQ